MARIILGSYMFRYPLGGMVSWVMQYLLGLKELGHDVYFVEKYGYDQSCYDPETDRMGNDPSYGIRTVGALLASFGFEGKWCFAASDGTYYGLSKKNIEAVFHSSDIFIDMGTHGSWQEESIHTGLRIWIDGEPGFTQIKLFNAMESGEEPLSYDRYFTNGLNVGGKENKIPLCGIEWETLFHPVKTDLFHPTTVSSGTPYTTVMNWRSHQPIAFRDKVLGQKNVEFEKFETLPMRVNAKMEIAVSGKEVPTQRLIRNGWKLNEGKEMTRTFEHFKRYVSHSKGEFSVCKNIFVATQNGWFSDKSAAYLASGKPVVLQDTGFSAYLPTGEGLFAVVDVEDAAEAIVEVENEYNKHARKAREIACEFFEASKVMKHLLDRL